MAFTVQVDGAISQQWTPTAASGNQRVLDRRLKWAGLRS